MPDISVTFAYESISELQHINYQKLREIKAMIQTSEKTITILIIAGICITIILGAAILWNQRKIKKMLRQIQEQNAAASKNEAQEE